MDNITTTTQETEATMFENMLTLDVEGIRQVMLECIPEEYFTNGEMEKTPQNINWMFTVWVLDNLELDEADLRLLLQVLNKHYSGEISIHEGWGGCEADSNQELISEKIRFDASEHSNDSDTLRAAVKMGWVDAIYLEEDEV